jgi:hypothetical protein
MSKLAFITNDLPASLALRETVDIQLANEAKVVLGRPCLYGLLLDKSGSPETFEVEGKTYFRDIQVFLPGKFPGTEEFLEKVHALNEQTEDLEKGTIQMAEFRKGTVVRVKLILGKLFVYERSGKAYEKATVRVPTVRSLAVVGWKPYPEQKAEEKEEKAPTNRKAPRSLRRVSKSTTA